MNNSSAIPCQLNLQEAKNTLRHHGKSFHFAGRFLAGNKLEDCTRLYSFCRYVDDIADCSKNKIEARRELSRVYEDLKYGQGRLPVIKDCIDLSRKHQIDRNILLELVYGLGGDLDEVFIIDWQELIRYCYRAAGTVGLLMSQILGASEDKAAYHAIDLGIAMQLTNIARDVEEDARSGRCYLPSTMMEGLTVEQIARPDHRAKPILRNAVSKILETADYYYASGEAGLAYLPPRSRLAILIASRVYKAIGTKIRRDRCSTWEGRAYVTGFQKVKIAAKAIKDCCLSTDLRSPEKQHQSSLHRPLAGMPKTHFGGISA